MRLLEVIDLKNSKIFEDTTPASSVQLPRGYEVEYEGKRYRWLGQQFVNIKADGSDGRPASSAIQEALRSQNATAPAVRNLNRANISNVNGKWLVSNNQGSIWQFTSEREARDAFRQVTADDNALNNNRYAGRKLATYDRARRYTAAQLAEEIDRRQLMIRISRSAAWAGKLLKILAPLGIGYELWASSLVVYDDIQNDPELSDAEKQTLSNTYAGIFYTEILAVFLYILRTAALMRRFISMLRWALSGFAAVGGASVVGAVPSAIAWLLGNVAITIAVWYFTRPEQQRALAEWLAGSLVGAIFEGVAWGVEGAAAVLDEVTGGAIGSSNLRRSIFWPDSEGEAPEDINDYYSSSEWGKILFAEMFKQGEPIVVPYISPARRESLMRQRLQMTEQQLTPTTDVGYGDGQVDPRIASAAGIGPTLAGSEPPAQPEPSVNSGAPGFRDGQ